MHNVFTIYFLPTFQAGSTYFLAEILSNGASFINKEKFFEWMIIHLSSNNNTLPISETCQNAVR